MRPVDVTPAIAERLLNMVYSAIKIASPSKFKVSDSVRVNKYKTIFEKSYTLNWTTEVFTIIKMQHTNPVSYLKENPSLERFTIMSCITLLIQTCIS